MKKITLAVLILIMIMGCTPREEPVEKTPQKAETEAISVFAQTLKPGVLPEYIKISAILEAKTDVVMISEVNGKLIKLHKELGDKVKKDEEIGEIDSDVLKIQLSQIQAAVLAAEGGYLTAQKNLVASEELFQKQVISLAEYENAKAGEKGAKAELDGVNAQKLQLEKMLENALITAPVSGVISELPITLHNYISQGSIICRIINDEKLVIKTGAGKSVIKNLKKNQEVLINTEGCNAPVKGIITGFGLAPAMGSINYPLQIEIANNGGLIAGEVVEASILLKKHQGVFVVRKEAIYDEYDHKYLYFIQDDQTVQKREITIEKRVEDKMIISGVSAGEKIVAMGTENVEDGIKVKIRQEIKEEECQ